MSGIPPDRPQRFSRRSFLVASGSAAAALTLYAGEISRHEVSVVDRPITIVDLPAAFHDYRIVQISDIHLDEFTEPFFFERIVHRVNELNPDMVLITGDFITHGAMTFLVSSHAIRRCAEILTSLKAPLRYGCLGNHDVAFNAALVTQTLVDHGTPMLVNGYLPVERNGSRIWICAVDDPGAGVPNLDLAIPDKPDGPVILMAHAPDYADAVNAHPKRHLVDLMLSGHSHGGQVRLPFVGPIILPPMGTKYPEGQYLFEHMQLYVNRGIGTVGLPFRFNCPPEITVHTLKSA